MSGWVVLGIIVLVFVLIGCIRSEWTRATTKTRSRCG